MNSYAVDVVLECILAAAIVVPWVLGMLVLCVGGYLLAKDWWAKNSPAARREAKRRAEIERFLGEQHGPPGAPAWLTQAAAQDFAEREDAVFAGVGCEACGSGPVELIGVACRQHGPRDGDFRCIVRCANCGARITDTEAVLQAEGAPIATESDPQDPDNLPDGWIVVTRERMAFKTSKAPEAHL